MNQHHRPGAGDNGRRSQHNGIEVTRLQSPDGATALVADHGAHLLSWCPADSDEVLFLSNTSRYGGAEAIRGGVPIIFPQFGERGTGRRHGVARIQPWHFCGASVEEHAAVGHWTLSCVLDRVGELAAAGAGAALPSCRLDFMLRLRADAIELELAITNTSPLAGTCNAALHTYLRVDDVSAAAVDGLQNVEFLDQSGVPTRQVSGIEPSSLRFASEVDRIYGNAPQRLWLHDATRSIEVVQSGFADTVVWNPGVDKAAGLGDLEPGGARRFICIEAAAVFEKLSISPGTTWRGKQRLRVGTAERDQAAHDRAGH